jgi:hypothetical protein
MQNAQSLFARLIGVAAAIVVCLPLAGCGGGQAAAPGRADIDFANDRYAERLERSSKLLELYGSEALPSGSSSDYGNSELTSLIDVPDTDARASK